MTPRRLIAGVSAGLGLVVALTVFAFAQAGDEKPADDGAKEKGLDGVQIVTAEGWGAIVNGDKAKARDEARMDAYRQALEQSGVAVGGRTEMQDMVVVYDKVITSSQGHVRKWQELRNWATEDDILHVEIKAEVAPGPIASDKDALPYLIDMMGNPRLAIITNVGEDDPPSVRRAVDTMMTKTFTDVRYFVVDLAQAELAKMPDQVLQAMTQGDVQGATKLAQQMDADILLLNTADIVPEKSPITLGGVAPIFIHANITAKILVAATGKVVTAQEARMTKQATALEGKEMEGVALDAASLAAQNIATMLITKLPRFYLGGEMASWRQLMVSGVSGLSQMRAIENALKNMRFVQEVRRRGYSQGRLQIDVLSGVEPLEILEQLEPALGCALRCAGADGGGG